MTTVSGQAAPGWYPVSGSELRYWNGMGWTEHVRQLAPTNGAGMSTYVAPARTAHGLAYWLLVGWWWGPVKWFGRVLLWLVLWPVGLWRSIVHGRSAREARMRRGAKG